MAPLTFHCTMLEFVSAVVGLTIAGAKAGESLYALVDTLKGAPMEFLALSDELTDFRSMLSKVIEAKDCGGIAFEENGRKSGLDRAMVRGEEIIRQIETFVQKVSKRQGGHPGNQDAQVNRIKWLRQVRRAKKLKEILRVQKSSICNFLALSML